MNEISTAGVNGYILERGCDPARIMALTFTKKAASEMKERIAVMVGERKARRLYLSLIHIFFLINYEYYLVFYCRAILT